MSIVVDRYPHPLGFSKGARYEEALTAISRLAGEDPIEAEACALSVLTQLWQSDHAEQTGASPVPDGIHDLLTHARKQGLPIPTVGYDEWYPDPPYASCGTLWFNDSVPVFFTCEPVYSLDDPVRTETEKYCKDWCLDFEIQTSPSLFPTQKLVFIFKPKLEASEKG